jgi:hypothetical protein
MFGVEDQVGGDRPVVRQKVKKSCSCQMRVKDDEERCRHPESAEAAALSTNAGNPQFRKENLIYPSSGNLVDQCRHCLAFVQQTESRKKHSEDILPTPIDGITSGF